MFLKLMLVRDNIMHVNRTLMSRLTHIGELKMLEFIVTNMNNSDLTWSYNAYVGKRIFEETGIPVGSQKRYISMLVKTDVVRRIGKGLYRVNSTWVDYGIENKEV